MTERDVDYDRYVDYKKLNLRMMNAAEEAIRTLIEVQWECEEMYTGAVDQ